MPENNRPEKTNKQDKDIRELQDETRKTPGYSDDPHIESSNRSPNNEGSTTQNSDPKDGGEKV